MHTNKPSLCTVTPAGIDLQEMYEVVTIQGSKAWYVHLQIFAISSNILRTGQPISISALELLNAMMKRAATSNTSKRLELSEKAKEQRAERAAAAKEREGRDEFESDDEGDDVPVVQVVKRAYSTTMSYQLATYLVAQQQHRLDGSAVQSRVSERLFGQKGSGRSSLPKKQKLDLPSPDITWSECVRMFHESGGRHDIHKVSPQEDTSLKAFCRLLRMAQAPIPAMPTA